MDEPLLMIDYTLNAGCTLTSAAACERYVHQNRLGSVVAVTDSAGAVVETYRYSPYGVSGAEGNAGFPFRFTGQKLDPETGRFLQTDPIGYEDQMNLYAYVHNDPVNLTDPTGECPWCLGAAIGAAIGGAAGYVSQVIVDSKDGFQLSDLGSEAALKAGATGALTGAVVGSGAGLVTSIASAAVIGGGVEAAAGAVTGEGKTAGQIGAAALNNAVATGAGVAGGKILEKAAGAAAQGLRAAGAAQAAANGAISPGAANAIGSTAVDLSGTVAGEVIGNAAGIAATYQATDNAPSDIVQRAYEDLRNEN